MLGARSNNEMPAYVIVWNVTGTNQIAYPKVFGW